LRLFFGKNSSPKTGIMKTKKRGIVVLVLLLLIIVKGHAQSSTFEGNRWRAGLTIQYSSNFKNLLIDYPVGYTGILGGFTGKGVNIFGGYKLHKYVSLELEIGVLINSYNRSYSNGLVILGRMNKFYAHPTIKFVYPIVKGNYRTVNLYLGGGIGLNGSGRLYLENRYGGYRDIIFAKYDPMLAPFAVFGAELLFSSSSNLVIGFKYQNGNFNANQYSVSYDPSANIKNAPAEVKTFNAQGLAFTLGFIQEF
jgi:hypothetical protein